jgi:hypothetical protein
LHSPIYGRAPHTLFTDGAMGSSVYSKPNVLPGNEIGPRAEVQTMNIPMRPVQGWAREALVALEEASTLAALLQGRPYASAILTHPQHARRTNTRSTIQSENPCLSGK